MFDFFADFLSWLYDLWPSYGGAIILFTLAVMAVMAPVTVRQTRSMMAMQRLQPEIKRLRDKYGNDREALNQEMMALYQANGVNPLGGCLPLLIQAPIFLVLFRLVQGLTRRVSDIGHVAGEAALFARDSAAAVPTELPERTFNPEFLDHTSHLFQDLSNATEMDSLWIDLSITPSQALGDGVWHGLPYLLLVVGVGLTSWIQQRQIQARSSSAAMNPQQQAIMKVLPFMLPVFSFGFPAALVVYFFVSNLFRVGQQLFITKRVYGRQSDDAEIVRPESVSKKKADTTSPAASQRTQAGGKSGIDHGSRRPVTNPPKKRKKPAPKPAASAPRKGKTTERREPVARPQSKRVTPKKNDQADASGSRRRNKKR